MPDKDAKKIVPAFEMLVSGSRLAPETKTAIYELEVTEAVDEVGMFSFSMHASDPVSGRVNWIDSDEFRHGNEVTIKLGFDAPLPEMMVGEITALEPAFQDKGPVVMTVRGYDRLYRFAHGRKARSFKDMKDSDIAAQIAGDWQLSSEAEDSGVTHEYVLQKNQTDMAFLYERAQHIGYEVRVQGKTLVFRKPKQAQSEVLTLTYGEDLLDFYPRFSIFGQTGEVVVKGWNAKQKQAIQGQAAPGDENSLMGGKESGGQMAQRLFGQAAATLVEQTPLTMEEADAIARSRFNAAAFDLFRGEGRCVGEPEVRAGKVIKLAGLGERFSGRYYITSATHTLSTAEGYLTSFTVSRSAA